MLCDSGDSREPEQGGGRRDEFQPTAQCRRDTGQGEDAADGRCDDDEQNAGGGQQGVSAVDPEGLQDRDAGEGEADDGGRGVNEVLHAGGRRERNGAAGAAGNRGSDGEHRAGREEAGADRPRAEHAATAAEPPEPAGAEGAADGHEAERDVEGHRGDLAVRAEAADIGVAVEDDACRPHHAEGEHDDGAAAEAHGGRGGMPKPRGQDRWGSGRKEHYSTVGTACTRHIGRRARVGGTAVSCACGLAYILRCTRGRPAASLSARSGSRPRRCWSSCRWRRRHRPASPVPGCGRGIRVA